MRRVLGYIFILSVIFGYLYIVVSPYTVEDVALAGLIVLMGIGLLVLGISLVDPSK